MTIQKKALSIGLLCLFNFSVFSQNSKTNVIFIVCDDLNDYQGAFGGHPQIKTPNIDKLASSGVRFVNAQSNVPVCSPSRNSFVTGVYPHTSRDFGWTDLKEQTVLKNNKTFMRFFKENGYLTLGTGKITHGNSIDDWDVWGHKLTNNYGPFYYNGKKNLPNPKVPSPYNSIGPIDGSYGRLSDVENSNGVKGAPGWVYGWTKTPFRYVNDDDRDLLQDELHAQWAINKLKELENDDSDKPFFMGIGFVRPHTPLHAPDRYFDMYPIDEISLEPWIKNDTEDTFWDANFGHRKNLKGPRYYKMLLESYGGDRSLALKHIVQAYMACVTFVDTQIGKLINALDRSSLKNNTMVVLTSDHGWHLGEKNQVFKNSPWEESARIPLILRLPMGPSGKEISQAVSLVDLYPTFIDYCNLVGDHKLNNKGGRLGGNSLRPLVENKKWQGPNGALTIVGNVGQKTTVYEQNFSYRTENWRYIRYAKGQEELYDHRNDPYEWHNLASEKKFKKTKRKLSDEMQQLIEKYR